MGLSGGTSGTVTILRLTIRLRFRTASNARDVVRSPVSRYSTVVPARNAGPAPAYSYVTLELLSSRQKLEGGGKMIINVNTSARLIPYQQQ